MDKEPPEPIDLQIFCLFGVRNDNSICTKIAGHIPEHISTCDALKNELRSGGSPSICGDNICHYFRWFYPNHYKKCQMKATGCSSCQKLSNWIQVHARDCNKDCLVDPCLTIKNERLVTRLTNKHRNLPQVFQVQQQSSSTTRSNHHDNRVQPPHPIPQFAASHGRLHSAYPSETYNSGSSASPYNPGSSASPYNPGSSVSPYNPGSSASPYNPGSSASPYNPESSASPYNPGSSASLYNSGRIPVASSGSLYRPAHQVSAATSLTNSHVGAPSLGGQRSGYRFPAECYEQSVRVTCSSEQRISSRIHASYSSPLVPFDVHASYSNPLDDISTRSQYTSQSVSSPSVVSCLSSHDMNQQSHDMNQQSHDANQPSWDNLPKVPYTRNQRMDSTTSSISVGSGVLCRSGNTDENLHIAHQVPAATSLTNGHVGSPSLGGQKSGYGFPTEHYEQSVRVTCSSGQRIESRYHASPLVPLDDVSTRAQYSSQSVSSPSVVSRLSSHDANQQSHDANQQSHDTNQQSHDANQPSWDNLPKAPYTRKQRMDSTTSSISLGSGVLCRSVNSDESLVIRHSKINDSKQDHFSGRYGSISKPSFSDPQGSIIDCTEREDSLAGHTHTCEGCGSTSYSFSNSMESARKHSSPGNAAESSNGHCETAAGMDAGLRQSDTIRDYSSSDDDGDEAASSTFSNIDPESTLPVTSLPHPLSNVPRPSPRPVQRQETCNGFRKIVTGRNSINLPRNPLMSRDHSQLSDEEHSESHDVERKSHDKQLYREATRSPRQSRDLTKRRKKQFQSQPNVISNSPLPPRRTIDQSNHSMAELPAKPERSQNAKSRCQSPNNIPDFEDLSDVLKERLSLGDQRSTDRIIDSEGERSSYNRSHGHTHLYSDRDSSSPAYDSSTGPSSIEEDQEVEQFQTTRRGRPGTFPLQRMDTDIDQEKTKILYGSGSLTPAECKHIKSFQKINQELVKLRERKDKGETNGNRTSGVSSTSVSTGSLRSSRASTDNFSELDGDLSSLERDEKHQDASNVTNFNYETEGSSSTIVGNSNSQSMETPPSSSMLLTPGGDERGSSMQSHSHVIDQSRRGFPSHYENVDLKPETHPAGPMSDGPLFNEDGPMSDCPREDDFPGIDPRAYAWSCSSESPSPSDVESDDSCVKVIDPHILATFSHSPPLLHTLKEVDMTLQKHEDELNILRHKPKFGGEIPKQTQPGMSEANKRKLKPDTYPFDKDSDYFPRPAKLPRRREDIKVREQEIYREMMNTEFTVDDVQITKEIDHRDQLKKYLLGQYYTDQVYREDSDWMRHTKLGKGAQATCFSVRDCETSCILVLKEESESKKTMDEAYVSLKFAYQSNPSPNVVEYYTAALLPGNCCDPPRPLGQVQIFMEHMPACLQGYLFKCGPISLHNVHHYACQLFDALDFLHTKQHIIHCDVKPANILVNDTAQRIKLTDFGAAELLEENHRDYSKCFLGEANAGTLSYNPPEFYRDQQCSFAFDIWQAGCCVLAMCTGRRPWRHLFMDVFSDKQPERLNWAMKADQRRMISCQTEGHMRPTFVDSVLQQLLYGCLHGNSSKRLTARESAHLLSLAAASTDEDKVKVHAAYGCTHAPRTPDCLQGFTPDKSRVDVYLGSDFRTVIKLSESRDPRRGNSGIHHAIHGGWLGSIECPEGTSYKEAQRRILDNFPVAKHLQPFSLTSCDNSPSMIWSACSSYKEPEIYTGVTPQALVNTSAAIVLLPCTSMV